MKKIKIILIISIISLFGCEKENTLEVICSEPLQEKDFKIEMRALASGKPLRTIYDGKITGKIVNAYGENDWKIVYKDSLFAYFRHIKTNRNDRHKYKISIFKKQNFTYAHIEIEGVSELNKTIKFTDLKKKYN